MKEQEIDKNITNKWQIIERKQKGGKQMRGKRQMKT